MNARSLSPGTTREIDEALFIPQSQKEYDRLDSALNAISENGKLSTRKLGDRGTKLIEVIQNVQGPKKVLSAEERADFKKDVLAHVRANIGERPQETDQVSVEKKKESRSSLRKNAADEKVTNVERRELQRAKNHYRKFSQTNNIVDLEELKDLLDNLSIPLILDYWKQATNDKASSERLLVYGTAFFDAHPSIDQLEEARKAKVDLTSFSKEVAQVEKRPTEKALLNRVVERVFDIFLNEDFYLISRDGCLRVLSALEAVYEGVESIDENSAEYKINREISKISEGFIGPKLQMFKVQVLNGISSQVNKHCKKQGFLLVQEGMERASAKDIFDAWTNSSLLNEPKLLKNFYGKTFFQARPSLELVDQVVSQGIIDVSNFQKELARYPKPSLSIKNAHLNYALSESEERDPLVRAHAKAVNSILLDAYYNKKVLGNLLGTRGMLYALETASSEVEITRYLIEPFLTKQKPFDSSVKELLKSARTGEEYIRLFDMAKDISENHKVELRNSQSFDIATIAFDVKRDIDRRIEKIARETGGISTREAFQKFKKDVVKTVEESVIANAEQKGFPIIDPSLEFASAHEIALLWIKAELFNEPQAIINRYARAFFDANPPAEIVGLIYKAPINLVGFSQDLDKYQDHLAQFGRFHSQEALEEEF